MTSSLRERRRQRLCDEILEAAQSLIAERGYAAMSMEDLAAQVGISKPTLYSHFSTKEDLVVAMATLAMERLFSAVDDGDPPRRSPLARLTDLLRTGVQVQLDRQVTAMHLWMPEIVQMMKSREESLAQLCRIDAVVVDLVRQAQAHGEIADGLDEPSVVRIFYALFMSPNVARLSLVDTPDPDTMPEAVARFFLRGVASGKNM
ncbi:TetR/AcrR family transcriptional regulator [Candidatus Oscillochloris fontis]|uniref:TetR/AcrR family transcriptional regulator n=1 Tax=Candidatus Oscillochloris fontis TaxID=2496868 RepID=UPI00101C9FA7|nr:TetR/AcrR family transcriptional regulator [Candidatus Oscillochloris fontis]